MPVASVYDIGCGDGTWLRVFRDEGITDIVGIDGELVIRELLQIPVANFQPRDLRQELRLQRSVDLAISLEVAEHLPESRAVSFLADLTRLAPVVLFPQRFPARAAVTMQTSNGRPTGPRFSDHDYVVCVMSYGRRSGGIEGLPIGIVRTPRFFAIAVRSKPFLSLPFPLTLFASRLSRSKWIFMTRFAQTPSPPQNI